MRILVVEDEKPLADAIAHMLEKNNYIVDVCYDGGMGQTYAESNIYDLIILDRMLPHKEGLEILKDLRKEGIEVPILILTAKDSIIDKVEGLDAGADDYLIKPFSKEELLARVKALARRFTNIHIEDYLEVGNLSLYYYDCKVIIGNEEIKLTLKETQLLEFFIINKNQVLMKEQIFDRIWGIDSEAEISNVELYVFYLRKKIGGKINFEINTVRGIGYVLKI